MTTKLQFKCSIGPEGCYQGGDLAGFLIHVAAEHPQVMADYHPARHDMGAQAPCLCYQDGYLQGQEATSQETRKPAF